jgi:hypothetical protein
MAEIEVLNECLGELITHLLTLIRKYKGWLNPSEPMFSIRRMERGRVVRLTYGIILTR